MAVSARCLSVAMCLCVLSCCAEDRALDRGLGDGGLDGSHAGETTPEGGGDPVDEPLDAALPDAPSTGGADGAPTDGDEPLAEHRTAQRSGPWFEGWYTRVTDEDGGFSLAVICGVHLPEGEALEADQPLSGYMAVLFGQGGNAPTFSYEVFPDDLFIASAGRNDGYECSSASFGSMTESLIYIHIPEAVEVSVELGPWAPWNEEHPEVGPEGPYGPWPLPLHWHVMSLASSATYRLAPLDGAAGNIFEGRGTAHQEKNWGLAFPARWIWLQGSRDGTSHVALAGGSVDLEVLAVPAWLVGFRSPTTSWDFRTGLTTIVETEIDACGGTFALRAREGDRELHVEAFAERSTFTPVSIPTEAGFRSEGGEESFSATVTVHATSHPLLPWQEPLVEDVTFFDAALEFGAANMCRPGG